MPKRPALAPLLDATVQPIYESHRGDWVVIKKKSIPSPTNSSELKNFRFMTNEKKAVIVGAGLVGALWAVIQGDDQIYALQQQSWKPVLRLIWPTATF